MLLGLIEFICLIGVPITLIGFFIQLFRKKENKKYWGIPLLAFLFATIICFIATPVSEEKEDEEKSYTEKFADKNKVSIELEKSLKNVLVNMELTDKSKVDIFM